MVLGIACLVGITPATATSVVHPVYGGAAKETSHTGAFLPSAPVGESEVLLAQWAPPPPPPSGWRPPPPPPPPGWRPPPPPPPPGWRPPPPPPPVWRPPPPPPPVWRPLPPPPPVWGSSSAHVRWCMNRYRSYNPRTDTYLGFDGRYHRCRSPYR
ncbi:BA14K family protein [Rhizobium arsenicireducens]